jgi:hypothetical protein
MKKVLLSLPLIIGLAACSSWPQQGHSGVAGQLPYDSDKTMERTRLSNAQLDIDALRKMGAGDYLPAALETVSVQWDRTARTVVGDFPKAASADLQRLEAMLSEMRENLSNILSVTSEQAARQQNKVQP